MSRKFFKSVLLLVAVLGVSAQADLTNGNFNTGDFTGWWTYCDDAVNQSVTIEPGSGYNYDGTPSAKLWSSSSTWSAQLGQSFDMGSNVNYTLSFVYSGECWSDWGTAAVAIKYWDASWVDLGVYPYFELYKQSAAPNAWGEWLTYSNNSFTTPTGTAHMELKFMAADWTNLHVDNVVVTPEPATMLLLGLGSLALRRRKRA